MNDRLHPDVLNSLIDQVPMPLMLHDDETTCSFVTRCTRLAVTRSRREVIADLFGSRSIQPHKPLHAGFAHLAGRIDMHEISGERLLAEHSYLRLFEPFIDPTRFDHARRIVLGHKANGINEILQSATPMLFRPSPAICLKCIEEDKEELGYSYHRRAHQIRASLYCAGHREPLLERCPLCDSPFTHLELPSLDCPHCGKRMHSLGISRPIDAAHEAQFKLAQVIHSILAGEIEHVRSGLRLAAYRQRAEEIVRNRSGILGDNLARFLLQTYGRDLMQILGLMPNAAPNLGWPALLIHGRSMIQDPVANILLIASLFDSVAHYLDQVARTEMEPARSQDIPKVLIGVGAITLPIVRQVIKAPALHVLSEQSGLGKNELRKWVAAYPGLSYRRIRWQRRARLNGYKKEILDLLDRQPGLSRYQIGLLLKAALCHVGRHDPGWLERRVPSRRKGNYPAPSKGQVSAVGQDELYCQQLKQAVFEAETAIGRPKPYTFHRLVQMSGRGGTPTNERSQFPLTLALAQHLAETTEEYSRRSLRWAAGNLTRQFGCCDNVSELFVHAGVGVKYVKSLEPYALSLLDPGSGRS